MILHRYILGQILWPIVVAFLSLNLLFLIVQMLKVAELTVGVELGMVDFISVAVLFLPGFAVFTIPISVLTGVMLGFGRMAEDEELVALAAAGVSGTRILVTSLMAGLVAGSVSLAAGFAVPPATRSMQRTFTDLSKRYVNARLAPGKIFDELFRVTLYPRRAGPDGSWDGFLMYDRRSDRTRHLLVARRAKIQPAEEGNFLRVTLDDGQIHVYNKRNSRYTIAEFEKGSIGIDIDHAVSYRTRFISEVEGMSLAQLSRSAQNPKLKPRERKLSATIWHRRFAFPVACVLFALLGGVLGTLGKLRGRRSPLVASLAIVAGFYLLLRVGDALLDKGVMSPAAAAWMPDVLVLGIVMWLGLKGRKPG